MKLTTELDINLDEQLGKVKELLKMLAELQETSKTLCFVSPDEFAEIYGCSVQSAREIFNRPDFPASRFSNKKKAEIHALINYFSVAR